MPTLRMSVTGSDEDARTFINLVQSQEGIEHVEEVSDLMPHMDDPDSSSAGLSDVRGPKVHGIEVEVPNPSTARKLRDTVEALSRDLEVLVEFDQDDED